MDVYWSIFLQNQNSLSELNFSEPENLYKKIVKNKMDLTTENNFRLCPSVKDLTKNIYMLKFPYDYTLKIDKEKNIIRSDMYDQDFFNDYFHIRSIKEGLFSFRIHYIFFCEEDLETELTGAYFSENTFVKNNRLVPGKLNIGKWPRPLDCAFIVNSDTNEIVSNKNDEYCYVNFLTKEDITLKKFYMSDTMKKIIGQNLSAKIYQKKNFLPLGHWYDLYEKSKQKSLFLKEIKNNLME